MKRLVSHVFASLATLAFGIGAFSVMAAAPARAQMPAPNFGSPPSGEIPILFNDQHVYSKPDRLRRGRVLAAIVRGKTILVPLRSMFEQMGATVSYDASTKTVDVSKPGADVRVTVGKPEVTINGETRPLDVPPEIYHGSLLVPVRVISEGMGAYVLWVADRHLVVVRYISSIPPTPTPATPAPPPPSAAPTQSPTPTPRQTTSAQFFLVGDAMFDPKVYNEFSPGNHGRRRPRRPRRRDLQHRRPRLDGRRRLPAIPVPAPFFAGGFGGRFRSLHRLWRSGRRAGLRDDARDPSPGQRSFRRSMPGTRTSTAAWASASPIPKIFLAGSFLTRYGNYGYPRLTGFGAGIEKLTNYNQVVDLYGSVYYYPQISGYYTDVLGDSQKLQYRHASLPGGPEHRHPANADFPRFRLSRRPRDREDERSQRLLRKLSVRRPRAPLLRGNLSDKSQLGR